MWQSNLKLAWRTLWRRRHFNLINILGLSVSVAACLLLFRMIRFESSFDRQQQRFDRIARVVTSESGPDGVNYTGGIPIPAMDAMQSGIPQFEQFARLHAFYPQIATPDAPGRKFATDGSEEAAVFIEPAFFRIFDWDWLAGDPLGALTEPYTAVLTKSLAEKCFGSWQLAQGKMLVLDQSLELAIRGVIADPPPNSDFQFNLLVSYETLRKNANLYGYHPNWGNISSNDQAWVLLQNTGQTTAANVLLGSIGKKEYAEDIYKKKHFLQPLADQHFDERIGHLGTHSVSRGRLWILSFIGLLIVAMACFNFINLATAQAASRSREVGVRKTLGSSRAQLIRQFLGETTVTVALSVALGAGLAALLSPLLRHVSDIPDALPFLSNPSTLVFLVLMVVAVSLLAGLYPAFVLAGFNPSNALKNNLSSRTVGGIALRKVLVLLQFGIAQVLIIGTLVTISQLSYIRKMDLGYQPELVYTITGLNSDSASLPRLDAFRNLLLQIPTVLSVSYASDMPSSGDNWDANFSYGRRAEDAPFSTFIKIADENYLKTYGLRLVAGAGYTASDTMRSVVVNQYLLKKLGIANPQEAIGKELRLGSGPWRPIVGVVADFTANSAREPVKPMTITASKHFYNTVGIKIRPENLAGTTAGIQQSFDKSFPEQVFNGRFLDERIAEFYRDENRFAAMSQAFALLAIFIAGLGLFGLASLMAAQKTKEIGIRKVLGASIAGIVGLLSRDFLGLVLLAFLLAAPVGWWTMNTWLQDFAYRTSIGWPVFVLTVSLVLAITALTIGYQAVKAASAHPVDSLRNE